jgi:hypothetical protein
VISGRTVGAFSLLAGVVMLLAAGCGVTVKRSLADVKPNEVVFDDLCGLQEYFDALKDPRLAPPSEAFARDIESDEKGRPMGGRKRFRFENEFQLHYLRRLLDTNWTSVPMEVARASKIELEVSWSEKGGVARVVTDEDAQLAVGPKSWALPYHVCLSDFLFGEQLYDTRRAMLQLADPAPSRFSTRTRSASLPPARPENDMLARPAFAAPSPAPPPPPAAPPAAEDAPPARSATSSEPVPNAAPASAPAPAPAPAPPRPPASPPDDEIAP